MHIILMEGQTDDSKGGQGSVATLARAVSGRPFAGEMTTDLTRICIKPYFTDGQ